MTALRGTGPSGGSRSPPIPTAPPRSELAGPTAPWPPPPPGRGVVAPGLRHTGCMADRDPDPPTADDRGHRPADGPGDTLVWSDAAAEIHQVVVGPMDNNVYVLRCRQTGDAVLIDAADEHGRLLDLCRTLGVREVLETHGHWDHIQAVPALRDAGYEVHVTPEDAAMLPSYDQLLADDDVVEVGRLRLRTIHTPGHTPGSMCFRLEDRPVLFSGDTLFPGGVGNTGFEGGDFPTIIEAVEQRLFRPLGADTLVLPGHGDATTIGDEAPHLQEWIDRGW